MKKISNVKKFDEFVNEADETKKEEVTFEKGEMVAWRSHSYHIIRKNNNNTWTITTNPDLDDKHYWFPVKANELEKLNKK